MTAADDLVARAEAVLADAPEGETREMAAWRHTGAQTLFLRALVAHAMENAMTVAEVQAAVQRLEAASARTEDQLQHIAPRRRGWRGWVLGDDGREGA